MNFTLCLQGFVPVHCKEHHIGTLVPDLIVDDRVLVDTKVVTRLTSPRPACAGHGRQVTGYLSHTSLRLGLLVNVKHAKLQWKHGSTDKIYPCNQCHPWLNTQTVDHMQVIALARDSGE